MASIYGTGFLGFSARNRWIPCQFILTRDTSASNFGELSGLGNSRILFIRRCSKIRDPAPAEIAVGTRLEPGRRRSGILVGVPRAGRQPTILGLHRLVGKTPRNVELYT